MGEALISVILLLSPCLIIGTKFSTPGDLSTLPSTPIIPLTKTDPSSDPLLYPNHPTTIDLMRFFQKLLAKPNKLNTEIVVFVSEECNKLIQYSQYQQHKNGGFW